MSRHHGCNRPVRAERQWQEYPAQGDRRDRTWRQRLCALRRRDLAGRCRRHPGTRLGATCGLCVPGCPALPAPRCIGQPELCRPAQPGQSRIRLRRRRIGAGTRGIAVQVGRVTVGWRTPAGGDRPHAADASTAVADGRTACRCRRPTQARHPPLSGVPAGPIQYPGNLCQPLRQRNRTAGRPGRRHGTRQNFCTGRRGGRSGSRVAR